MLVPESALERKIQMPVKVSTEWDCHWKEDKKQKDTTKSILLTQGWLKAVEELVEARNSSSELDLVLNRLTIPLK
jgi:hypothetical protein